jgi:tRNA threonylcarbamoyl adenosine modification protein (Sua5/YciO/YrdC/YwlC family)
MGVRIEIHPQNPQARLIKQVVDCLQDGGIIIYPTDTVYALGCDIQSKKALERVCQIKGIDPEKSRFTCICPDFKSVGEYAIHISNPVFKAMRRALPGPYTFILEASKSIPRHFQSRRKTVGVRVTEHPIPQSIVEMLGRPILSSSLPVDDGLPLADPDEIYLQFGRRVDMVIDGGWGGTEPSTVVDCTSENEEWEVVREGAGPVDILY